jgi:hypothetical protein
VPSYGTSEPHSTADRAPVAENDVLAILGQEDVVGLLDIAVNNKVDPCVNELNNIQ